MSYGRELLRFQGRKDWKEDVHDEKRGGTHVGSKPVSSLFSAMPVNGQAWLTNSSAGRM